MSAFGFKVGNGQGQTVTDSNFLGYGLLEERQFTVVSQSPTDMYFDRPVTSQAPPIVAVKVKQWNRTWIRLCRVMGTPGNWTYCRFVGNRFTTSDAGSVTYDVRVYATGLKSTDSFGMRIVNELNQVTIDSGFKQLEFTAFTYEWSDWPLVVRGDAPAGSYGQNRVKWVGYQNPNLVIPSDGWLALSLANNSYTTTMESNATGRWGTYPMEVESTFVYDSGRIILLFELYAQYLPLNYNIQFNTFCPIIKN